MSLRDQRSWLVDLYHEVASNLLAQYGDYFATPSCVRCREERLAKTTYA